MKRPKNGFKTAKQALKFISQLPFSEKRKVVEFTAYMLQKENGKLAVSKYCKQKLPRIVAFSGRSVEAIISDTINKVTSYTF